MDIISYHKPTSLAEVSNQVKNGLSFSVSTRDFFDCFEEVDYSTKLSMLAEEPALLIDPIQNAYLAALAEWLSNRNKLEIPLWTQKPERHALKKPYFAGKLQTLKPYLLQVSPLPFKARMLFVDREPVSRPHKGHWL